jgi:hypothetical protein
MPTHPITFPLTHNNLFTPNLPILIRLLPLIKRNRNSRNEREIHPGSNRNIIRLCIAKELSRIKETPRDFRNEDIAELDGGMAIDPLACHGELDIFTCTAGEVLEGYDFAGSADCLLLLAWFLNVRIKEARPSRQRLPEGQRSVIHL